VATITGVCGVEGNLVDYFDTYSCQVRVASKVTWPAKVRGLCCVSKTDGPADKFRPVLLY
jgi:hypothetical protein